MSVTVRIPTALKKLTGGAETLESEGGSVRELIDGIEAAHPGIKARICDDSGQIRRFVNVYVDGDDIRFLGGLETPLEGKKEVSIVPSIAGG